MLTFYCYLHSFVILVVRVSTQALQLVSQVTTRALRLQARVWDEVCVLCFFAVALQRQMRHLIRNIGFAMIS